MHGGTRIQIIVLFYILLMKNMSVTFSFFPPDSALLFWCIMIITFLPTGYWTRPAIPSFLGNETDQLALLAFKAQITRDPLQALNSWNASRHFCKWHGVTCGHRHQRVVKLDLMSHGLVGSLSPHIGNISFLHNINLSNNSFGGEIPSEVGQLLRLQEFDISNNSFSGGIPINLSRCYNLRTIHIGYNKLTGMIPKELGSLSKLMTLYLHRNNLTGIIPPSLGNLSYLENFHLSFNSFGGSIPKTLGNLKNLQKFGVTSNMLSSIVPPIYNLSSLTIFSISGNQIHGSLPPDIGLTLPNLRLFYIGGNQFSGSIPTSLSNMSKLAELDNNGNSFTGQVPTNMGSLQDLQWLNLAFNHLGSGQTNDLQFISSLINCSSLQMLAIEYNHFNGILPNSIRNFSSKFMNKLILGGNQISGSIPAGIENLLNLVSFDINGNQISGSIPTSVGKLHNLQKLDLGENRLSGEIPSSLGNLSNLYLLDISGNELEGGLIPSINNFESLQILNITANKLNGTIPKQFFGPSSQLFSLYLAQNSFFGSLPMEVGNLKNLVTLDISKNNMTGEIPSTLGNCLSLEKLNLMGNSFQGPIPPSFSSLKGLQVLDLSVNNLYGQIPAFLQNLPFLRNLNLSFNNLEGEVPHNGVFQSASTFSILGNNKLCGGIKQLHLPPCPSKKSKRRKMSLALKVLLGVIPISMIVFASFLCIFLYQRRRRPTKKPIDNHFWKDHFKRVSYQELHQATEGFAPRNLIGKGSFGAVYKGVLLHDQEETPWAVKVLNLIERDASKTFIVECQTLRKVRHRNLLKILTVCSSVDFEGNDFKALIFKFMPNGSLENWLHPTSDEGYQARNLNLPQRINIAIDIASALEYLHNHCDTPIIHCDLKPSNVLLDEDMVAHVSDFGLAKFLHKSNNSFDEKETSSIYAKGTIGYIPPEYGMGDEASTQGDVYSYGILLLEIITGKKPTDGIFKDGLDLHHFCSTKVDSHEQVMKIVDQRVLSIDQVNQTIPVCPKIPRATKERVQECLISIARVGVACSMRSPSERLVIKDALKELLSIKQLYL